MAYDGDDRRVSSTNRTGATTKYIFDGGNVIQETDGAGSLIANYNVEPQELMGNIVGRKDAAGLSSFYHYSALANDAGNVTSLTNSTQSITATYNYEAFGNMVSSTGTVTNAYKFSTKNLDDESGLYYFGARYYDPETGRFITKDPDGGDVTDSQSLNPYVYVKNNPQNLVDPDGLLPSSVQVGEYSYYNTGRTEKGATIYIAHVKGERAIEISTKNPYLPEFRRTITKMYATMAVMRSEAVSNILLLPVSPVPSPPSTEGPKQMLKLMRMAKLQFEQAKRWGKERRHYERGFYQKRRRRK